ncbi:MAG: hypothetical protein ABJB17_08620 [Burkholderiales bacterium]
MNSDSIAGMHRSEAAEWRIDLEGSDVIGFASDWKFGEVSQTPQIFRLEPSLSERMLVMPAGFVNTLQLATKCIELKGLDAVARPSLAFIPDGLRKRPGGCLLHGLIT